MCTYLITGAGRPKVPSIIEQMADFTLTLLEDFEGDGLYTRGDDTVLAVSYDFGISDVRSSKGYPWFDVTAQVVKKRNTAAADTVRMRAGAQLILVCNRPGETSTFDVAASKCTLGDSSASHTFRSVPLTQSGEKGGLPANKPFTVRIDAAETE